MRIINKPVN